MSPRHFSAFYQAMLIYIGLAKYHADYHSVINVIYRENGGSVIDNFLALGFAEIMLTSKLRVREAVFANIPENDQALYLILNYLLSLISLTEMTLLTDV